MGFELGMNIQLYQLFWCENQTTTGFLITVIRFTLDFICNFGAPYFDGKFMHSLQL